MRPWLVPITVVAALEGLHWWNPIAAYVAAALIGGFCLGRLYEAGSTGAPIPTPPKAEADHG